MLDLARVAGNREMVVPGAPDESELWELVHRGEMPPADSPTGSLSHAEKEAIRAWIAAGAPAEDPKTAGNVALTEPTLPSREAASAVPLWRRFLVWLGSFHLLVLHFPIALLIAATMGECWAARQGSRVPAPAVRFCILLGAAGAVAAAGLGWLHAWNGNGAGAPTVLALHGWIGTATAAGAVFVAVLSEREARRGQRTTWFRVWLFAVALLVAPTGHLGGMLVHGADFLQW
jgi:uncharacterized membrane protein